jgi:hypothetical protein
VDNLAIDEENFLSPLMTKNISSHQFQPEVIDIESIEESLPEAK